MSFRFVTAEPPIAKTHFKPVREFMHTLNRNELNPMNVIQNGEERNYVGPSKLMNFDRLNTNIKDPNTHSLSEHDQFLLRKQIVSLIKQMMIKRPDRSPTKTRPKNSLYDKHILGDLGRK